jgi:hypothetical protein
MNELKPLCTVGLVGGSDFKKIAYQMGGAEEGKDIIFVTRLNGQLPPLINFAVRNYYIALRYCGVIFHKPTVVLQ